MGFKLGSNRGSCPEDPESLLRDLRKKTIPGLLSHQADLIRSYLQRPETQPDIALQLPTGSGKTLVGLLIGEWRRRKYGERVVYLCPTNQLVNQVANHSTTKYGIDVQAFTGRKDRYDPKAASAWQAGEAVAITNYSSLFNTAPFFSDPHLIILDDAHSAENYISKFWSLLIDRSKHEPVFTALAGVISALLPPADRSRLSPNAKSKEDHDWVEKIPTPILQRVATEIVALLDEYTQENELRHSWQMLRDSLHACHLFISRRTILIRPLIPPTNTHGPFANAKQRIYMSATLGAGGDLERITGRCPILHIPIPQGWDTQGIGRRFFLFPKRSLDDRETRDFTMKAIKLGGRAIYLVPDSASAEKVIEDIGKTIKIPVFTASEIEESKQPFVESPKAVAVVANRYDGIDLVDEDCRMLFADGLPEGANLQERFFVLRVTARLLLDDRILTRLVQGFGRCTRSPNDYAAVIVLGENLNSYLFARERRQFFHPEIQAELQFGLEQSRDSSAAEMLDYLRHFFAQDSEWDKADREIVALRSGMTQKTPEATGELAQSVASEIAYQYALWHSDFAAALEHCRAVLGKLAHSDLKGYRALWLYLAGSAAWLASEAGQLQTTDIAKDYFRKAQAAAPVLRWLMNLSSPDKQAERAEDTGCLRMVERLESVLESLGTVHDRKYDAEENQILSKILQDDEGTVFEEGHKRLGTLLGFHSSNSSEEGAPDPWWIVDDSLCFVFEDNAEAQDGTILSVRKARQVASHPNWIRAELNLPAEAEVIPVLITPCITTTKGAVPHLKKVKYWRLDKFRDWSKNALKTIRDIRREFTEPGNMAWRLMAATKLKQASIAPTELRSLLKQTAADAMVEVSSEEGT